MLNHEYAEQVATSANGTNVPLKDQRLSAVCKVCAKPSEAMICPACGDRIRAEAVARKMRANKGLE
jgi:hypothetical protein